MVNKKINWEKIGIYIAAISFVFSFWITQFVTMDRISDIKERVRALEVKVEHLEEKK